MIKRWHKAILILWLLPGLFLFQVNDVQAAAFPNGSFETNPSGSTSDWTTFGTGWSWDASTAHSGTRSAKATRSSGQPETASLRSAYVTVQPSTIQNLTFWIRTTNANFYPRVDLSQYTSATVQIGPTATIYSNIGTGTNGWMQVTYRFQTLPNAAKIRLRIYLYSDTTGSFWFDDFSLTQEAGPARFPFQAGFPVTTSQYGKVWLASPTVEDIDQDGDNELFIGAGKAVNGWNSQGQVLPGFPLITNDSDFSIVAQIAVADVDGDGRMEIFAGTRAAASEGQCNVHAWNHDGSKLSGWPKAVAWSTQYSNSNCWITSVVPADLDGDGDLEVVASTTNNGAADPYADIQTPNLYAWHGNGALVSGSWPNQQTTAGVYGAVAAGDISNDGKADVIVGRDYLYLNAYGNNGVSLPGWPIRTFVNRNNGDYNTEQRIEYSVNAPIIADLDGNGSQEVVVVGHVKGPGNLDVKLNSALLVLNSDGTRFPGWQSAALGSGLLAQADLPWQGAAVGDLNSDGQLEIVVATEDGYIRAYRSNSNQPIWAFNYTQGATLFGTDPVIGDIDDDGALEILFGTYVPELNGTDKDGPIGLWALEANGSIVQGFPLPVPTPGMRSAPTLADLDKDGFVDILAATRGGHILVWDTPTRYDPTRLPWPTGRHDNRRTATYTSLNPLEGSDLWASPILLKQNEIVTFTVRILSSSSLGGAVSMADTLPPGLAFVDGSLHASAGSASYSGGTITWSGNANPGTPVDVTFGARVITSSPQSIQNAAVISAPGAGTVSRSAIIYVNFRNVHLPATFR